MVLGGKLEFPDGARAIMPGAEGFGYRAEGLEVLDPDNSSGIELQRKTSGSFPSHLKYWGMDKGLHQGIVSQDPADNIRKRGTSMTNDQDANERREQRLDARMEYGHLVTVYLALANMMWLGFGAFFTINTLLVTGLGFSYTDTAKSISGRLLVFLHVAIPLTGMCMSSIAVYAAILISNAQKHTRERGIELEKLLSAKMITRRSARAASFPYATAIGSSCFFIMWCGVLVAVIQH